MRVNDTQLFRALVLLALREKELGSMPAQRLNRRRYWRQRRRRPSPPSRQVAALIPSTAAGLPRDVADAERLQFNAARTRSLGGWLDAAAMTDPVDVYLNVSLACASDSRRTHSIRRR